VSRQGVVASDVSGGHLFDFLSTLEGVQLAQAFMRVTNPKVRRRFISLVKSIAEDESE
jgi:hypothetical protein